MLIRMAAPHAGTTLVAALVAVTALVVQAGHLFEHLLQIGYWVAHPAEPPWMTPWGMHLMHLLGEAPLSLELLHLIGNAVFLVGLVALAVVCRAEQWARSSWLLVAVALAIQGLHVLEHVALTQTVVATGQAIGVSTLFGQVEGPVMTTWRVWFHFLINFIASAYTVWALLDLRQHPPRRPLVTGPATM